MRCTVNVPSGSTDPRARRLALMRSSVRLSMVSSLLVLKRDLRFKLIVHLRLNVFNDETNLTRTEVSCHRPAGLVSNRRTQPARGQALRLVFGIVQNVRFRAKMEQLDFDLKARARIWPWLSYMCYIRSTAARVFQERAVRVQHEKWWFVTTVQVCVREVSYAFHKTVYPDGSLLALPPAL